MLPLVQLRQGSDDAQDTIGPPHLHARTDRAKTFEDGETEEQAQNRQEKDGRNKTWLVVRNCTRMVRFGGIGSTMESCISTSLEDAASWDGCSCDCERVEFWVGEGETNGSNLSGCDCGAGCGEACDKLACEDECTALLPGDGCNDVAGNAACDVIAWGEKGLPCDEKDPACGPEGDKDVRPRVACGVVNTSVL